MAQTLARRTAENINFFECGMEEKRKKILLLCVTSQNVITFRSGLIKKLQEGGYDVAVVAFDDERKDEIEERGIEFYCVQDKNRSLNPFKILSLKSRYKKIIRRVQPDIVFTFMMKPNIFGCMAAKSAKVGRVYAMVEGAGDVFINDTFKWKMVRFFVCKLYKKAFKTPKKVFFLNEDDKREFLQRKLVKEAQCEIVHGVGVDLEKFAYKPIKNHKTFLMVARMLKTKGVFEYCKAARLVKEKYPDAVFNYVGAEGTVKLSDIQEYIDDGSITYLGTTNDVRSHLENCLLLLLLSSYREGLPMSIMEAEAVGRAIITSNNVGCRDTVQDGYNGFLVEREDYQSMAEKAIWCIEHFEEAERMGKNARIFAEEHFDSKKINEYIFKVIEE